MSESTMALDGIQQAGAARGLVVLLHGVGSNGADLLGLADVWRPTLPEVRFVAPDAPERLGGGYQWFSVAGVSVENRPERVRAARDRFDATVLGAISEAGFAGQLDRVVLVGFSQGTIMALDALASGRWPVAGVVGFSGRLASPLPYSPSRTSKLLLIHGDADRMIPASDSVAAGAAFEAMGVANEVAILKGVPHTISAEGAALAGKAIAEMLGV